MTLRSLGPLVALCLPAVAAALPLELPQQGRLLDATGEPLTGSITLDFALWDAAEDGSSVWSETLSSVDVVAGHYSVVLGRENALDSYVLDGNSYWLSVSANGEAFGARTPVLAVPYAVRADTAEAVSTLAGACERAGQVRYTAGVLELCDGTDWQHVRVRGTLGLAASSAAPSCAAILADDPTATTGVYWLAMGGTPFQTHCDMQTNGGGWTLVASIADDDNNYWTRDNWGDLLDDSAYGSVETALTNDFKSPAWGQLYGQELLVSKASNGDWLRYDTVLDHQTLSQRYTSNNVTVGEFGVAATSGSWWYQCSSLNMSLQREDSDANTEWGKGFIWRSSNNDGCSYDDIYGGMQFNGTVNNIEQGWTANFFYTRNFDASAALVWVR